MTEFIESGAPVRRLQTMLAAIGRVYPQIPVLVPDGVFGERTLEAVMAFQRDFGLPVTGVVDRDTWEAIHNQHRRLLPERGTMGLPTEVGTIRPGESDETVYVAQRLLDRLYPMFTGFEKPEQDGALRGRTLHNIRALQDGCGQPVTGILDDETWRNLIDLFRLFALRWSE